MGKKVHSATKRAGAEAAACVSSKLAAYGEAFLQTFEDAPTAQTAAFNRQGAQPSVTPASPSPSSSSSPAEDSATGLHAAEPSTSCSSEQAESSEQAQSSDLRGSPADVQYFVFDSRQVQPGRAAGSGRRDGGSVGPSVTQATPLARQRRLFLAGKALDAQPGSAGGGAAAAGAADSSKLPSNDFRKMQREVEQHGSQALDRKAAKQWRGQMLTQLGARTDKVPRLPASIGKGMAKKAAERRQATLEEAAEAGMVQRRSLGKLLRSKSRDKPRTGAKNRRQGLRETGGAFRDGVLRVSKPARSKAASGGRSAGRSGRSKPRSRGSGGLGGLL